MSLVEKPRNVHAAVQVEEILPSFSSESPWLRPGSPHLLRGERKSNRVRRLVLIFSTDDLGVPLQYHGMFRMDKIRLECWLVLVSLVFD